MILTANMVLKHFMRATFERMNAVGGFRSSEPKELEAPVGYLAALAKQKEAKEGKD